MARQNEQICLNVSGLSAYYQHQPVNSSCNLKMQMAKLLIAQAFRAIVALNAVSINIYNKVF